MKRYIAFNGSSNSGIQTHEKAIEWAKKEIQNKTGLFEVPICAVIETVERVEPVVQVKPYKAAAEQSTVSEVAKAA